MNEFENVKDALADLIDIVESHDFEHEDGTLLSANEVLELASGDVYSIADLLGLSCLYLDQRPTRTNKELKK